MYHSNVFFTAILVLINVFLLNTRDVLQDAIFLLDGSQPFIFSCFSSIVERGERAASELNANAKREARGGGGRSLAPHPHPRASRLRCSPTLVSFFCLEK